MRKSTFAGPGPEAFAATILYHRPVAVPNIDLRLRTDAPAFSMNASRRKWEESGNDPKIGTFRSRRWPGWPFPDEHDIAA